MLITPIEEHSTNRLVAGIPLLFVLCSYIYHYSTELFIPRLIRIFTAICTAIFETRCKNTTILNIKEIFLYLFWLLLF